VLVGEESVGGAKESISQDPRQTLWLFIVEFCNKEERAEATPYFNITGFKDDQELQVKGSRTVLNGEASVLIILEDKTNVALLQEALNEAKHTTVLIASTSHELRTPLCGVINALELMQDSLNKGLEQYHEIAISSSRHLLSTVNDILVS